MFSAATIPPHFSPPTYALKAKLRRLYRVREELQEDGEPIPPELDAKIQEVRGALELCA